MLNLIVKKSKNAFSNGISLAGNTLGAIMVFLLLGQALNSLHYSTSLLILAFGSLAILLLTISLYLIPQRHISKFSEDEVKMASQTGT